MEAIINQTFSLILEDTSQTAEARRIAQRLCKECNFSEEDFGKFSIIVTELSMRSQKHQPGLPSWRHLLVLHQDARLFVRSAGEYR